jgi:hypothetical protein
MEIPYTFPLIQVLECADMSALLKRRHVAALQKSQHIRLRFDLVSGV